MARANASGGFVRPTTTAGAHATNTFSASDMAVVMPTTSTLGSARICLDDRTAGTTVRCRTVDLSPATGTGPRQLVFAQHGLSAAHTFRLSLRDVSGRIELDAIALLK